eukprot:6556846-Alexandrium_andersonii.AAC.1
MPFLRRTAQVLGGPLQGMDICSTRGARYRNQLANLMLVVLIVTTGLLQVAMRARARLTGPCWAPESDAAP